MSDTEAKVKGFITESLLFDDPGASLDGDTVLLEGLVDSLGLMQLVAFLEEEFEIQISDADITSDNFRSVEAIAALVDATRA